MAKDSFWFKHDSNAGRDLKLLELCQIYTHWGKGVYWDVIEVLREQNNYKFEKDKIQSLCGLIMCNDFVKFENWYKDCLRLKLFIEDKKYFFSKSLINRMNVWEVKKINGGKGGRGNKSEIKAKRKLNKSEIKAKRKYKIREYKIREDIEEIFSFSLDYFDNKYLTNKWKDCVRLLIDVDNRDVGEIKEVIKWARNDKFWSKNFISPLKLRSKDDNGVMYYDRFKVNISKNNNEIDSNLIMP